MHGFSDELLRGMSSAQMTKLIGSMLGKINYLDR